LGLCPQTCGERERREGEGDEERGREGEKGGEGIIHKLLPQTHTTVAAYADYSLTQN